MMDQSNNDTDGSISNKLFIHTQFEIPQPAVAAADVGNDEVEDGINDNRNDTSLIRSGLVTTKQSFDTLSYKLAIIGLPEGAEPIKVCRLMM